MGSNTISLIWMRRPRFFQNAFSVICNNQYQLTCNMAGNLSSPHSWSTRSEWAVKILTASTLSYTYMYTTMYTVTLSIPRSTVRGSPWHSQRCVMQGSSWTLQLKQQQFRHHWTQMTSNVNDVESNGKHTPKSLYLQTGDILYILYWRKLQTQNRLQIINFSWWRWMVWFWSYWGTYYLRMNNCKSIFPFEASVFPYIFPMFRWLHGHLPNPGEHAPNVLTGGTLGEIGLWALDTVGNPWEKSRISGACCLRKLVLSSNPSCFSLKMKGHQNFVSNNMIVYIDAELLGLREAPCFLISTTVKTKTTDLHFSVKK